MNDLIYCLNMDCPLREECKRPNQLTISYRMNTDLIFSSKTDMWATPQAFFDEQNKIWKFDTDVCAIAENTKCGHFFTPDQDGLKQPWKGVCWMNPPYGRQIGKWIEKAYYESILGATIVSLLPARTDTRWFHKYIYGNPNATMDLLNGRLKFGDAKFNAPFPCMVVVFKYKQN